jgi:DNA-binding transcriptional MerR regulator
MPRQTKPVKETWRDWQAQTAAEPAVLLTRGELLERLAKAELSVTERDLLYWQAEGIIPYPVHRNVGRARYAYYPEWVTDLIRALRKLQAQGWKLEHIRKRLRKYAVELTIPNPKHPLRPEHVTIGIHGRWELNREFTQAARHLARVWQDEMGPHIQGVVFRLFDDQEKVHPIQVWWGRGSVDTDDPEAETGS